MSKSLHLRLAFDLDRHQAGQLVDILGNKAEKHGKYCCAGGGFEDSEHAMIELD